jgi:hypothetical protein
MTRRAGRLAALLLALTAGAARGEGPADAHDLFVFAGDGPPVRLRLRVERGGQPVAAREAAFLRDWFAGYAPAPGGALDTAAAARAVRQNPLNRLLPGTRPAPEEIGLRPGARLTPDELARRWARRREGRFLHLEAVPAVAPHAELLTRALVAALDRDRDGRLTEAELRAAGKVLPAEFDSDEDECVTPFELVPALLTAAPPARKRRGLPALALLHPGQTEEDRVAELCAARPGKAAPADAARWLRRAPDREVTVRVDNPSQRRILVRAGGWLFDLCARPSDPGAPAAPDAAAARRRFAAEADRDGNGTTTDAELDAYLARLRQAEGGLVTLTASPGPRSWFEILDADGDGQLGARELRSAWERLADADADGRRAGFVPAPDWDAPVLTLTFTPGVAAAPGVPLLRRAVPRTGPEWFRAMDRNGDGDVSPREFLGTAEAFRRLDRDGDGLLSPEEAEAAAPPRGAKP